MTDANGVVCQFDAVQSMEATTSAERGDELALDLVRFKVCDCGCGRAISYYVGQS